VNFEEQILFLFLASK